MGMFTSKKTANITTIAEKLAVAKLAVTEAERKHRDTALEAVLTDNMAALSATENAVAQTRHRVESLTLALEHAERLERERIAAAANAVEKSRRRAIQGHIGEAVKIAQEIEAAIGQYAHAWQRFHGALDKIARLARYDERDFKFALDKGNITRLVLGVMLKQAGPPDANAIIAGTSLPGAPRAENELGGIVPYGRPVRSLPPFSQAIKTRLEGAFAVTGRAPPPPAPPAPVLILPPEIAAAWNSGGIPTGEKQRQIEAAAAAQPEEVEPAAQPSPEELDALIAASIAKKVAQPEPSGPMEYFAEE